MREFLGKTGKVNYQSLKSGLNAVPLIVTDGQRYIIKCNTLTIDVNATHDACYAREEEAALVAGMTGYKVEERVDPVSNNTIPVVSAVQGWGMLMSPDAIFRNGK